MFGIAGTAELSTFCPGTGTWNRLQDGRMELIFCFPLTYWLYLRPFRRCGSFDRNVRQVQTCASEDVICARV